MHVAFLSNTSCYLNDHFVFLLSGAEIIEGPSDVILIPPETVAVFSCNVTEGETLLWRIDNQRFLLSDPLPPGHVKDGSNLNVTMGVNGTQYNCFLIILSGGIFTIDSSPAFLFIAGKFMHAKN